MIMGKLLLFPGVFRGFPNGARILLRELHDCNVTARTASMHVRAKGEPSLHAMRRIQKESTEKPDAMHVEQRVAAAGSNR